MNIRLSHFKRVPLTTLRGVLRSVVVVRTASTPELSRACGLGEVTVKKAMVMLSDFGLVAGDDAKWEVVPGPLDRSASDETLEAAIREALLAYRPFEGICEGLLAGEPYDQASRHTAVILGLDTRAESNLDLLRQLGLELGVLVEDNGHTELSEDLRAAVEATPALPIDGASSTAEIRLYVSTLLGRDAFDELDEIDRGLLAEAVRECETNPAASVEASGQALEDYLRELCIREGLGDEAGKLNGAGQLASLLRGKNLIHAHHLNLINAAGVFRNAKAHKKDKQTVAPWKISPLGARTAFGAAALAIRSVHAWVKDGGQEL